MKNFLIYKSSAGSGKTYTLVKEYLKIVLRNPEDYKHTLAITFTNKAADEMRQRVLEKLIALSENNDPYLEKTLKDEGLTVNVQSSAKDVLNKILHNYSGFSITTIDSFSYKIIRAFARELSLHLGYTIEIDTDSVMNKIVDDLLDEIGTDEELTRYIEDFIFYSIEDDKGWKIDYRIKNIAKEIFKERYQEIKNNTGIDLADNRAKMKAFIDEMFKIREEFQSSLIKISTQACKIIEEYCLEIEDFKGAGKSVPNYIYRLRKRMTYSDEKNYKPTETARKTSSGEEPWFKKDSLKKNQIIKAVNSGLGKSMEDIITYYDNNIKSYTTASELVKTIYILGIFNDLNNKLINYRDEHKVTLISDLNMLLKKIITNSSDSPFIYEKTGTKYKNFLIDEFQDTSNFQWDNLLPLIINSLAENNFSMIVGDVKQAIYRWRNGNMKLLLKKVREDLSIFGSNIHEERLGDNRRSGKEIIRFNNNFFKRASDALADKTEKGNSELIRASYTDIEQKDTYGKDGGYVNISFIRKESESGVKPLDMVYEKLHHSVKELIDDRFSLKDIMILTRRTAESNAIAAFLLENKIRVISEESLLLTNSPKVKLLINLLKYIADNYNWIARTEILYNYLVYIKGKETDYCTLFRDYKQNGNSLFRSELPEGFFYKDTSRLNPRLNNLTLYELIENLIMVFSLNDSPDAYLIRFMDAVLEFSQKQNSDIISFLDWWEENINKISIIVPEQEDAVRVMTIHKAKGLQSPAVIIPFASWDIDISEARDFIWVSSDEKPFNVSSAFLVKAVKSLENSFFEKDFTEECVLARIDNLNLMYVAFTRAIERLYIFCPHNSHYDAGDLIEEVLKSGDILKQTSIDIFETGIKEKYENPVKSTETKSLKPDNFIDTDYHKKVVIKPQSELLSGSDAEFAMERGKVLHKALSYIIKKDDIDDAILKIINEGLITEELVPDFKDKLQAITELSEIKSWFSGEMEIKPETEILMPSGKVLRPDRVMIKNNKAIIADYKSGKSEASHSKQVNEYAEALIKAGYNSVDKYILYLGDKKLIKV